MKARFEALALLAGSGTADFAMRITQVALPLVILRETGSVAATGLVGGASGIPVLLSPWWARKARQWVDSGPRLALVALVTAIALASVPAAAGLGLLTPELLVFSGLLLGCGTALADPGRSALLADTGDRWGPDRAVLLLTWQDGLRRVGMLIGPTVGALAVSAGFTNRLLWIEAVAVVGAGLLACTVPAQRVVVRTVEVPSIRGSLKGRPEVLYGWLIRGTGCVTWFAFTLGLSVLGEQRGRPGIYLAAGMTGYGVGSLIGTAISLAVVRRIPPVACAAIAWSWSGLCWIAMGLWSTPAVVAVAGAFSGVTVVVGIAAISVIITRSSAGAERRTLLSGQAVVVSASSSAGLLIGGPIIATVGAQVTLVGAGTLTALIAGLVLLRCQTALHARDRDHHVGRAA
ncbi:MFS transporter [Kribbella jiaozuonensis]|uniref:MFS transporter n=1 Tax=Kribbella jiaozuonensis TaxID=2575441 RepID=A0A4V5UW89_9ACTN|nr:MFS transporter [Kribbella jiaozuonensis]TKK76043.1 MFS transporter [Kribbella jiaozuonensis]